MTISEVLFLGSLGILIGVVGFMTLRHFFNSNSRDVRKRTRSYGPVVSRKQGLSIKLAVDLDERKKNRK